MITSSISFYPCKSIVETEKFYTEIVGLKLIYAVGNSRIFSANKGNFGFVEYDGTAATGRLCLSLNCESKGDVDKEYERIIALGAKPEGKPENHANFSVYSFFLKDTNGYLVEFQKISDLDI
ncbi:VOC family protein [Tyzzerella sp. OttesenSCG-928-J15]|nr:VOC family protein [Tyzzerella sp. OttesenSCG-928-J15]